MPESVVIVRHPKGWVAHIRYANRFRDKDIACNARYLLERKIDYLFKRAKPTW